MWMMQCAKCDTWNLAQDLGGLWHSSCNKCFHSDPKQEVHDLLVDYTCECGTKYTSKDISKAFEISFDVYFVPHSQV